MAEILVDRAVRLIVITLIQLEEVIRYIHLPEILQDDVIGTNSYARVMQDTDGMIRMIRKLEPVSLARMYRDCRSLADKFSLPSRVWFVRDDDIEIKNELTLQELPVDDETGEHYIDCSDRVFTAMDGFMHYMGKTGIAIRINFSQINTASVRAADFPAVAHLLRIGSQGVHNIIDARLGYDTGDSLLGFIRLILNGILNIASDGYTFRGTLKSGDDTYDFNKSTHRSPPAEFATAIGRSIPGRQYKIHIRGARELKR